MTCVPASSGECPVKPAFIGLNNCCSAFGQPSCTRCPWQKLGSQKGHLMCNILLSCQVLSSRSLPLIGSCLRSHRSSFSSCCLCWQQCNMTTVTKKCHYNARKIAANSWEMSMLSLPPNSISICDFSSHWLILLIISSDSKPGNCYGDKAFL